MKKKIVSLFLALALMLSLAIPAFAATYSSTGSYTGTTGTCTYHAYATCNTSSWNALLECTGSTDSANNYSLKVVVYPYEYVAPDIHEPHPPVYGNAATRIANNYGSVGFQLLKINAVYKINESTVLSTNVDPH